MTAMVLQMRSVWILLIPPVPRFQSNSSGGVMRLSSGFVGQHVHELMKESLDFVRIACWGQFFSYFLSRIAIPFTPMIRCGANTNYIV